MQPSITIGETLRKIPIHAWIGLLLITVFWTINWTLEGLRTHWGFFPMWLGYCLFVDGLVLYKKGTSLLTRSWEKYLGLFAVSAPAWWLFEVINYRLQNWHYRGAEYFSSLEYTFWATLSFTTVIPAVFGTAEFIGSFDFFKRARSGLVISTSRRYDYRFFHCRNCNVYLDDDLARVLLSFRVAIRIFHPGTAQRLDGPSLVS
jgi:hypothetical protein